MMKKQGIFWFLLFTVLMIAAVAYIFLVPVGSTSLWGLPGWMPGFLIIELAYCLAMWFFVQRFWKEDKD